MSLKASIIPHCLWQQVAPMLLVGLLTLSVTSPARATPSDSPQEAADALAAHIEAVAPDAGVPTSGSLSNDQVTTETHFGEVVINLDPAEGISISGEVRSNLFETKIHLPDNVDIAKGTVAQDGTVVFASDLSSADTQQDAIAVQTLDQRSTRIQTIIATAQSEHSFEYRMDGLVPSQADDGSWIFISPDGSGLYVPVDAPWAVDAHGSPVETFFEIKDDALVQVVSPTDTVTYPITADPTWQWNGGGYGLKLNRTETRNVRTYAAASGMCTIMSRRWPGAAVACGGWTAYLVLQANFAESDRPRSCLFAVAVPAPGTIWRVKC
ncbi:hypothetical protein [Leucobacter sp. 1207-22]|uniref:hypothetical protein n=1 Tax=Leucobacter sp. 1207-22 TaxID=2604456 RepID=UPI004063690E